MKMLHLGMELADLLERSAFFFREVARAMEHQSYGSTRCQFDRCGRFADLDSLLLHAAKTEEKPFNRHG